VSASRNDKTQSRKLSSVNDDVYAKAVNDAVRAEAVNDAVRAINNDIVGVSQNNDDTPPVLHQHDTAVASALRSPSSPPDEDNNYYNNYGIASTKRTNNSDNNMGGYSYNNQYHRSSSSPRCFSQIGTSPRSYDNGSSLMTISEEPSYGETLKEMLSRANKRFKKEEVAKIQAWKKSPSGLRSKERNDIALGRHRKKSPYDRVWGLNEKTYLFPCEQAIDELVQSLPDDNQYINSRDVTRFFF